MKKWLVFDCETTGLLRPQLPLAEQPKIIELALTVLTLADLNSGEDAAIAPDGKVALQQGHASWLINPGEKITDEITKITGLTNADLEGKPRFAEVFEEIADRFEGVGTLIAHNLPFDLGMLVNDLTRCGKQWCFPYPRKHVCSIEAYRHEFGRRMKLTELYARKCKKPLAQTHRASDDVAALVEALIADEFFE